MEMIKKVCKVGNGLCVFLDKIIVNKLRIKKGDRVKIKVEREGVK